MATKQNATIALRADTSQLRKDTNQAEKDIGKMAKAFDAKFIKEFNKDLEKAKKLLSDVNKQRPKGAGPSTTGPRPYGSGTSQPGMTDFMGPMRPAKGQPPARGPASTGGGSGSMLPTSIPGLSTAMGMLGIGMGVAGLFNKRVKMAEERLDLSSHVDITKGGFEEFDQGGNLGYTPAERRKRGFGVGAAFGTTNIKDLTEGVKQSELASRVFGMGEEQSAGMMTNLRKGGSSPKEFGVLMEGAVQAGLDGSLVVEYLQEQSEYLASINDQTVDLKSISGFTEAITTQGKFFQENAGRTLEVVKAFDKAFSKGDRFQQARAMRSIQMGAPGASMNATEMRRSMGLFGSLSEEAKAKLPGLGVSERDQKALGLSGKQLTKNMMKDFSSQTKGMDGGQKLSLMSQQFGLNTEASIHLLAAQNKKGGITEKDIEKAKILNKTVEEKAADMMGSIDGGIKKLDTDMNKFGEATVNLLGKIFYHIGGRLLDRFRLGGKVNERDKAQVEDKVASLKNNINTLNAYGDKKSLNKAAGLKEELNHYQDILDPSRVTKRNERIADEERRQKPNWMAKSEDPILKSMSKLPKDGISTTANTMRGGVNTFYDMANDKTLPSSTAPLPMPMSAPTPVNPPTDTKSIEKALNDPNTPKTTSTDGLQRSIDNLAVQMAFMNRGGVGRFTVGKGARTG